MCSNLKHHHLLLNFKYMVTRDTWKRVLKSPSKIKHYICVCHLITMWTTKHLNLGCNFRRATYKTLFTTGSFLSFLFPHWIILICLVLSGAIQEKNALFQKDHPIYFYIKHISHKSILIYTMIPARQNQKKVLKWTFHTNNWKRD